MKKKRKKYMQSKTNIERITWIKRIKIKKKLNDWKRRK